MVPIPAAGDDADGSASMPAAPARRKKARPPFLVSHRLPLAVCGMGIATALVGLISGLWLLLLAGMGIGLACMGFFVPELQPS